MAKKSKTEPAAAPENGAAEPTTRPRKGPSDAALDELAHKLRGEIGTPVRWTRERGGYGILFPGLPEPACEPTRGRALTRSELGEALAFGLALVEAMNASAERGASSSGPRALTPAEIAARVVGDERAVAAGEVEP